jgi:hypothetical protein
MNIEHAVRIMCSNWMFDRGKDFFLGDTNIFLVREYQKKVMATATFKTLVKPFIDSDGQIHTLEQIEDLQKIVFKILDEIAKKDKIEKDFADN